VGDFVADTEPYRRELIAHCYRMLGSVDDAEDVVQETYLRAWRSYDGFEGRSSVRTWLYQIATNASLSALTHKSRRLVPSDLGPPSADPAAPPVPAGPEVRWLQPIPDAMLDPGMIVEARDSLRIALIATLQHLPGRQRAVLILRDVLAWPASEVAQVMGTSTAAVKSTLQRARARLKEEPPDLSEPIEPGDLAAVLDQYIAAVEEADGAALERLLRVDARVEATPWRTWYSGRATCVPYLVQQILGSPGDWRLRPTSANGQPAAVGYFHGSAYGILVLAVTKTGIARINGFASPELVAKFGFPAKV
jgi:RNA polymerase sigma-70 factor (ECF subfamily)